jgi:hypothetical protein
MTGFGNKIQSITIDGTPLKDAKLMATLTGKHTVNIQLANNQVGGKFNKTKALASPETPHVTIENSLLYWPTVQGAVNYKIIVDGKPVSEQAGNTFPMGQRKNVTEIQAIAVDAEGTESFASEPLLLGDDITTVELEDVPGMETENTYRGFSGKGYVHTSLSKSRDLQFDVEVPADGVYAIDFRYANGNGPVNTENKCAIRTLMSGNENLGCIVLPQRGKNEWSDWGFTNNIITSLKKGVNHFALRYQPWNANMNGDVNEAVVDYVRLMKLK